MEDFLFRILFFAAVVQGQERSWLLQINYAEGLVEGKTTRTSSEKVAVILNKKSKHLVEVTNSHPSISMTSPDFFPTVS